MNRFPAVESHLGVRASYVTRRKRRYERTSVVEHNLYLARLAIVGLAIGRNLKGSDKIKNNYNTSYNHYYNINLKPKVKTIAPKIFAHTQMHK